LTAVPQVPTFTEARLSGFNPGTWYGIMAPAGTPWYIIDALGVEFNRMATSPEFKEKMVAVGLAASYLNSTGFSELIKTDLTRFGQLVKSSNIKL